MYDSLRKELYWTYMAKVVYGTVCDCCSCAQNLTHGRRERQHKQFFSESSLEYFGMDILGPLPKTKHDTQVVVVMTDRYNELTKAILSSKKAL